MTFVVVDLRLQNDLRQSLVSYAISMRTVSVSVNSSLHALDHCLVVDVTLLLSAVGQKVPQTLPGAGLAAAARAHCPAQQCLSGPLDLAAIRHQVSLCCSCPKQSRWTEPLWDQFSVLEASILQHVEEGVGS